jgi:hypothetical protein
MSDEVRLPTTVSAEFSILDGMPQVTMIVERGDAGDYPDLGLSPLTRDALVDLLRAGTNALAVALLFGLDHARASRALGHDAAGWGTAVAPGMIIFMRVDLSDPYPTGPAEIVVCIASADPADVASAAAQCAPTPVTVLAADEYRSGSPFDPAIRAEVRDLLRRAVGA